MFPCDQCPVAYGDRSHLDRHRQIHAEQAEHRERTQQATIERAGLGRIRNVCQFCQGRFTTSEVLKRHIDAYHSVDGNPRNSYAHPATPPQQQAQARRASSARPASPNAAPVQHDHAHQPSVPDHPPADEHTTGGTSPTGSTISLASGPPVPGEVDVRAGSLGWLDFKERFGGCSLTYGSLVMALDSLDLLFRAPCIPLIAGLSGAQVKLLPGIELLRQLVNNFFLKWQKIQPIFHLATWKFVKTPLALLGAMACIGALLDEDDETAHQAHIISSRCVAVLNVMAVIPPENGPDIRFLAAVCLHQTYLLGSGDEHVYHHVDRIRAFLVGSLQRLGLLGSGNDDEDGTDPAQETVTQPVQAEWTAWIAYEQAIRTTWAVFEYDCSVSLLTNRPCVIELGDLPLRFPCADELYEAPDAQCWAELRSRSPNRSQGPLVSAVVAASAERTAPLSRDVSPWTRRLCTQIFERILRGFGRRGQRDSTVAACRHVGLNVASVCMESTAKVIWAISFLAKSIPAEGTEAALSTSDLVNFCSTKLIRHYAQLSVYTDVMDLITYIARVAASPSSPNSRTSLRWAQQKLIDHFAVDPPKSRQYIWHAGQMIRIAKVYAVFAPGDNLRIFSAYLAIIAFVKYGPSSLRDVDGVEPFQADAWPFCEAEVERWLQAGGPARIGSCHRIQVGCSTDQIMQDAFQMLYRLENWGISERFFNILVHFNELDVLDG
ncbi:hypothetical protein BBK36DRAFT_1165035 [Trichoderma citrinoviride]|uniref:C2H2-type domain-containing protein n=1 Tax=Trichoderma citrinoviride TaxID=58853 RepID=A0A2T4BMK1_9HYPO|nr:hypothetical protein BBK36DRAFT_1165035 [Trichoderma citrinoviride]PTB70510.1 hypothetical protein BBK36DRAFT_1165035 [Trichoderma citrinoviride]